MTKNKVLEKMLRTNLGPVNLRIRLGNCDSKRMPVAVEEHHELVERMKKKDVLKKCRDCTDACTKCAGYMSQLSVYGRSTLI